MRLVGSIAFATAFIAAALGGSASTAAPPTVGKIVVTSKAGDAKGTHFDLYLLDAAGGPPTQLTKTPALDELWPTFSPDGTQIAFVRYARSDLPREGLVSGGPADLYVMRADGGPAQRITHLGPAFTALNRPSWSPDGQRILFDAVYRGNWPHIYEVAASGGRVARLTSAQREDIAPMLSPDGKALAVFRTPHDGEPHAWKMALFVINLTTGKATRITSGVSFYDRARWAPDGSRLVVSRDAGKYINDIWTVAPDGSTLRQLSKGSGDKHWPAWSPDGSHIAYVRLPRASDNYGYIGTVTTVRPNGAATTTLPAPLVLNEQPDWRPQQ